MAVDYTRVADPVALAELLWPDTVFYDKQKEILYSLWENDETMSPAGNMLGKDFVTGHACVLFFITRQPCRIITTSVDNTQLEGVLWGEIKRAVQSSKYPLEAGKGGPLHFTHMKIRRVFSDGSFDPLSYLIGRVAEKGEGMLGHHIAETGDGIPRTLYVADEASGVDDVSYERADTWARRKLIIGNPYPCNNFFKRGVTQGDLLAPDGTRYYRKIIRITGDDSPNVRYAKAQQEAGQEVTHEMLVPGVLPYADYEKRRATWDPIRQCIGLDARFYEGSEVLMYPPLWRTAAEQIGRLYGARTPKGRLRRAKGIGIDPAQGGDSTAMCAVDEYGIIELVSRKTPNTRDIPREAKAFIRKHGLDPENCCFDLGGGGKQHADSLREDGFDVRTVAFGGSASPETSYHRASLEERIDDSEVRYTYLNRRAQMYHAIRLLLDPDLNPKGFGIPEPSRGEAYKLLSDQMAPIPLLYDNEGKIWMLPKDKKEPKQNIKTLLELCGQSPDELDALALAVYAMQHPAYRPEAGAIEE